MKANELRIGNYVLASIKPDNARFLEIECYDIMRVRENSGAYTYEPIPLTEEWLVRFGFKIDGVFCYLDFNPRMQIRFHDGNPAECDIVQDGKYIAFKHGHINHVHQLQNLYFALIGEELSFEQ